jgi:hypothetical protein
MMALFAINQPTTLFALAYAWKLSVNSSSDFSFKSRPAMLTHTSQRVSGVT